METEVSEDGLTTKP